MQNFLVMLRADGWCRDSVMSVYWGATKIEGQRAFFEGPASNVQM